jgi:hypothetical protein
MADNHFKDFLEGLEFRRRIRKFLLDRMTAGIVHIVKKLHHVIPFPAGMFIKEPGRSLKSFVVTPGSHGKIVVASIRLA